MRHKNAAHRHLQWYSSCHLLHQVAISSSAVLAISSPCWKGAFILFYLYSHVMSARSIGVKALSCRHLQCYSYCRLVNLLHQITACIAIHYLWRWPVRTHVGREISHTRVIWAQCTYILLFRIIYVSKFSWCHIFKCCLFDFLFM